MKFNISITNIKSVARLDSYWTNDDYRQLLVLFDYEDAHNVPEAELWDMLSLAISDFEAHEAAEVVLSYKLQDELKEGQIKNLAQEMQTDKVAEEYQDMTLHYKLFNINQLLYDAYNGKFPQTKASVLDVDLVLEQKVEVSKELMLRALSDLLSERSLLKRLYDEKLDGDQELTDAKSILWTMISKGENTYQITTSDVWLNSEDFDKDSTSGVLRDEEIH